MDMHRLQQLLAGFDQARILVVGDFFLDKYLVLDAALTETSLETGLEAYQVTAKRCYPGAAGTVTSNLRALDAGTVYALGMIGIDGEGFELKAGLRASGINLDLLIETDEIATPTYTKPMLCAQGRERELNRFDSKNRRPCPPAIEAQVLDRLRAMATQVDAILVADQVQERNCGVITDIVRAELAALADQYPELLVFADSRTRIDEYRRMWVKPNRAEAIHALKGEAAGEVPLAELAGLGRQLRVRNGRPLFITLAEQGILAVGEEAVTHVPTLKQTDPIDICGAGDSTLAGMTLALCRGASPAEAALVGNLVASITVQQIGVTGTASRAGVLQRFAEAGEQFAGQQIG